MARNQKGRKLDQPAGRALSDLDKALADLAATPSPTDIVPEGWRSRAEWADISKQSHCYTREKLRALIRKGEWERCLFRIMTPSRGVYPTPHYRKKPD